MIVKKTNKAKLVFKKDIVEKIYYDHERAKIEYDNYNKLHSIMKEKTDKNWSFRSPEIYCLKGNKLTMERAKGSSLDALIKKNEYQAAYYAGVYLGLFHKNSRKADTERFMSYGDYNRTNVFVDFENKTIWGIDPGDRFGKTLPPENDIMSMFFSITIEEVRNKYFRFNCSRKFIRGYKDQVSWDINTLNSIKSLQKIISTSSKKRYSGIKSMIIQVILSVFLGLILIISLYST